jgi:hypothetical protein
VAGPHPDPDTSYETLPGSLDVNQQETRNILSTSVADPDPRSGACLKNKILMEKFSFKN